MKPEILSGQAAAEAIRAIHAEARKNEQAALKEAKENDKEKEKFSIEKLIELYPSDWEEVLRGPGVIEDLEVAYYLHHKEFKTLAEFVAYELWSENL
jgi:hypothetical protein